jgi:glycerophosphoryl diester phosphodiesterase
MVRNLTLPADALLFLSACLYLSCMHPKGNKPSPGFDIQGHRGCRGLMPENTIPAMLLALDLGVTTLEMDAVISHDHQLVVSHEPFFNHEITTKPDGKYVLESEEQSLNIYTMNYDSIAHYDVGSKPHPRFPLQKKIHAVKPLLSVLIDSTEAYARQHNRSLPYYNIETKTTAATDNIYHPGPNEFVDQLVELVRSKHIEQRVIIQSFDTRTLQYLHTNYPYFKTALLIEGDDKRSFEQQVTDLGFTPDIYSPEFTLVTEAIVNNCHRQNIKIIPWTVNEPDQIIALKKMGVDGLISDYPNKIKENIK